MTKKALKSVKKACVLLMATTSLLTTSCREDREMANSTDNGQISFSVIDGNSFSSRAGEVYLLQQPKDYMKSGWYSAKTL